MTVVFLNFSNGANPPRSERFFSRAVRVFLPFTLRVRPPYGIFFNLFFFFSNSFPTRLQAKACPLRRSLAPQEAEGAPQGRQRRSFHGFELVNREQDSGYEPHSEAKIQEDTSTIDIDEAAAAEVLLEFITEVGERASKLAGDYVHPGAGDVFQTAFRWKMRLLKRLF